VPPRQRCAAFADLFAMLDRSLGRIGDRHAGARVHIALHAVEFTVEEAAEWERPGRDAFVAELLLAQPCAEGSIARSDAFAEVWAACPDIDVPLRLARAGLRQVGVPQPLAPREPE
jgi:hypothetical protein